MLRCPPLSSYRLCGSHFSYHSRFFSRQKFSLPPLSNSRRPSHHHHRLVRKVPRALTSVSIATDGRPA
ncbi:unnamed protein product [Amoebophrya sp. A25]|nr:unnamed protein product [Amoebophrya sp. A25]|eukprot:GSA25T00010913001.1